MIHGVHRPGPAAAVVGRARGPLLLQCWTQGSWWPVSEWGLSEAVTDKTPSRDQKANNKHRVIRA